MIRYKYIYQQVLKIYQALPSLHFPLSIFDIVHLIPNCRILSYQDFADLNHCSVQDIVALCNSPFGCTHYDVAQDRYLILYNHSHTANNNYGRQRWTCAHEIGHILCRHHLMEACKNVDFSTPSLEYEREADFFAATLLAPFPLFKLVRVRSVMDIQNIFGLSCEASLYQYKKYLKWLDSKIKTAWENDIIQLYQEKIF